MCCLDMTNLRNDAHLGRTQFLSWNFSEGLSYNSTIVLSKIRCIKGLTSHGNHKWHDMAIIMCFLIPITKAPERSSLSPAPHHDLHQRVAIGVVVLLMLLLLKLHPSKIVNASASTNISIKTTLWLLPVAVPSTCKSIFLLQHDHLIHPIYHITSLDISHHNRTLQKQV